jgi:heat shock protein HslJ
MRTLRLFALVALVVTGSLASAACSSSKGGPIEGRTWHVRGFADASGTMIDSPLTVPLDARYEGGNVTGSSGCSTFAGTSTVSGEVLTVSDIKVQQNTCDAIAMDANATYMAALPKAATFRIDGTELIVYDKDGKEILHCRDEQAAQQG